MKGAQLPFALRTQARRMRCMGHGAHGRSGWGLDDSESILFIKALRDQTIGSAYASFDEEELGALTKGKQPDFVVWDRDLNKIKTGDDVSELKVISTWLAGKAVFQGKQDV